MYIYLKKTKYPLLQDICVSKVRNVLSANIFLIISETQEMKRKLIFQTAITSFLSFTGTFHLFQHEQEVIFIFGYEKQKQKLKH